MSIDEPFSRGDKVIRIKNPRETAVRKMFKDVVISKPCKGEICTVKDVFWSEDHGCYGIRLLEHDNSEVEKVYEYPEPWFKAKYFVVAPRAVMNLVRE